jgi:hypothetical protein
VYDGKSLRVYIDGKPAHRICREPEIEIEGGGTTGGGEIPCEQVPEEKCRTEWEYIDNRLYPNAICVIGSIVNNLPVYAGNYDPNFFPNHPSLEGMEDEIRISNYPKYSSPLKRGGKTGQVEADLSQLLHETSTRRGLCRGARQRSILRWMTKHVPPWWGGSGDRKRL